MRIVYTLSLFFALLAPRSLDAQVFKIYDNFSELEERIAQAKSNTLLVINFWATYCKPCVKELSYFNDLHQKYASADFEILLVSLDFKSQLEKKFLPFLRATPLYPEIILMSDQDSDGWIPRVKPDWNGAIPITLLVRGTQRDYHEGEFESYADLERFIRRFFESIGEPSPIPEN